MKNNVYIGLCILLFSVSCRKKNIAVPEKFQCNYFMEQLRAGNDEQTNRQFMLLTDQLFDKKYSRENVDKLVAYFNTTSCAIQARLVCFECIYTTPPQSEIELTFTDKESSYVRTLDISSNTYNVFMLIRVHEGEH